MNVSRELGKRLIAHGHNCRHLGDIGMAQASDMIIVEEARRNNEIIVTHDLDYGNLLAFSGKRYPSVIIIRLRNTHQDNLLNRIMDIWTEIERPLLDGVIVVLEDDALRIRRLPIT